MRDILTRLEEEAARKSNLDRDKDLLISAAKEIRRLREELRRTG